jgi:hypothetical protein
MLKAGDKYVQVAPIEEYGYYYPGREFVIKDVSVSRVAFYSEGLGQGVIDIDHFQEYFKKVEELEAEVNNNIKRVIRNGWATIVILEDGSKGVAKCSPDDEYDADKGLEIATLRAEIKSKTRKLKSLIS